MRSMAQAIESWEARNEQRLEQARVEPKRSKDDEQSRARLTEARERLRK